MIEEDGVFAVKLSFLDGISAEFTGEHFIKDDIGLAVAKYGASDRSRGCKSPVYLVSDSIVRLALAAKRNAVRMGMSDCTSGIYGEPCNDCEICRKAEREAFTRAVLGGIRIPGEFHGRLMVALSKSIGMTCYIPLDAPMTEREVEEAFKEMGTERKGETDESH